MDNTLLSISIVEWIAIAVMACAGSWMFQNIKSYNEGEPGWPRRRKILSMFVVNAIAGAGVTPGVGDYLSWNTPFQRMIIAFGVSFILTTACRLFLSAVESDGASWIRTKFFGNTDESRKPGTDDKNNP